MKTDPMDELKTTPVCNLWLDAFGLYWVDRCGYPLEALVPVYTAPPPPQPPVAQPANPSADAQHDRGYLRGLQAGYSLGQMSDEKGFAAAQEAYQKQLTEAARNINAQPEQEPVAWPAGLIERIKAAEQRIQDGHAPRRIPADPTDVDLVLAEVRCLLEGKQPPLWIQSQSQTKGEDA